MDSKARNAILQLELESLNHFTHDTWRKFEKSMRRDTFTTLPCTMVPGSKNSVAVKQRQFFPWFVVTDLEGMIPMNVVRSQTDRGQ